MKEGPFFKDSGNDISSECVFSQGACRSEITTRRDPALRGTLPDSLKKNPPQWTGF
jgi:hypothetical protein